jgi:hypothetical protein
MRFSIPALALATLSGVLAAPTDFFGVDITFLAGPASYSLTVPADGQIHPTGMLLFVLCFFLVLSLHYCSNTNALPGNDLSVSIIRSSNFDVYTLCTFYHDDDVTLVNNGGIVSVGPPTPITGVSCPVTDDRCIPTYGKLKH